MDSRKDHCTHDRSESQLTASGEPHPRFELSPDSLGKNSAADSNPAGGIHFENITKSYLS